MYLYPSSKSSFINIACALNKKALEVCYERILNDRITESYKLDHSDTTTQINRDTAKFAQKVNMIDRVGKLEERSAYILFKDHKKNFPDKKQTRTREMNLSLSVDIEENLNYLK